MLFPVSRLTVRIYYEDTDCANTVYYANYLRYMERGRTEIMRDLGFEQAKLHEQDTLFVVAEAHIKYHKPARYNDILTIETSITGFTPLTIMFHGKIYNQNTELCVTGDIKAACVDKNGKLKKIPEYVLEILGRV
jgi:acyl-CoA thioester hydrolase